MKLVIIILCILTTFTAFAENQIILDSSHSDLTDWQHKSFAGETRYQWVTLEGQRALQAISDGSASGLFIEKRIDITRTPYLNWRWRIENQLIGLDEKSKAGDDYPARLYIIVSGGLFFWKTKTLNYVWSSSQGIESSWDNAYTSQAKMLAVESGASNSGQWRDYKRNVFDDLRQLFSEEITHIDGIAIMTDTDNSQQQAIAYYGDIYFSDE